jgi:hypothetical protein
MSSYCGVKKYRIIAGIEPVIYICDAIYLLLKKNRRRSLGGHAKPHYIAEFQQRDAAVNRPVPAAVLLPRRSLAFISATLVLLAYSFQSMLKWSRR